MKFRKAVKRKLFHFRKLAKDCQILLFSTTYDDEVRKFANTVVPDPIVILLRREEEIPDNIKQYYVVCQDQEDKQQALSNMYAVLSIGQCIVFCQVSMLVVTPKKSVTRAMIS